jgi:hypothetical protein
MSPTLETITGEESASGQFTQASASLMEFITIFLG